MEFVFKRRNILLKFVRFKLSETFKQKFFATFDFLTRMNEFFKILSVFFACLFFFGKAGIPAAIVLFKFSFWKVMLMAVSSAIIGNVLFTYMSATFIKWLHNFRAKRNRIHRKQIFTKFNRGVVRIKQRFGLVGIACITPIIGMPIGTYIAERFFKDKRRVIIYLSTAEIIWAAAFYWFFYLFYDTFKKWGLAD